MASTWTWQDIEEQLEAVYTTPEISPKTWKKHRQVVRVLAGGREAPADVSAKTLAWFVSSQVRRGLRPRSINSLLQVLRTQLGIMAQLGVITCNPWNLKAHGWFVPVTKADKKIARHQPIDDVRRLLDRAAVEVEEWRQTANGRAVRGGEKFGHPACRAYWRALRTQALLSFLLYTGTRANEALYLRIDELDLDSGVAYVTSRSHRLKTSGSDRIVPVPPQAAQVLRPWVARLSGDFVFPGASQNKPWLYGSTKSRPLGVLKGLGERAGIERPLSLLGCRHTFITHGKQVFGLSADQVKLVVGHTTIETQEGYEGADVENVRKIGSKISFAVVG